MSSQQHLRFLIPLFALQLLLCSQFVVTTTAFRPSCSQVMYHCSSSSSSSSSSVCMVRRGKGSIGKEVGGGITSNEDGSYGSGGNGMGGMGRTTSGSAGSSSSSSSSRTNINWTPLQVSVKALPTEENAVSLIDTNLVTMKNAQTNPTGAVSVIQYKQQTYCFAVNCPSCQIPLIKAKALPGNEESQNQPRLQCDLCKATYNLKTGDKLTSTNDDDGKVGIMGNIVKSIFASKSSGPLRTYQLGEKNGKLLIGGLD